MGSPGGVGDDDEYPEHEVYLSGYWIDQTEVTNGMYAQCVNEGGCTRPDSAESSTRNSYYGNSAYDNYPVIYVDWYQAEAYCEWVGRELPTEAQWERAARGTDGRTYPWGNKSPNSGLANFDRNVGDTTEVGRYPEGASPYGTLDMAGNVWEWVADWYDSYPSGSVTDPQGPSMGDYRVIRGGSWLNVELNFRSANRSGYYPDNSISDNGFRCSLSLP